MRLGDQPDTCTFPPLETGGRGSERVLPMMWRQRSAAVQRLVLRLTVAVVISGERLAGVSDTASGSLETA